MMDVNQTYWEDSSNVQHIKYECCNSNDEQPRLKDDNLYRFCDGNLNFATVACSEDDSEYGSYKKNIKASRQDPMSHRIIEKRRRDRMNNCLADLSRLIPADYLKKGRGRIEKTEIIEMAIKYMKYLQQCHRTPGREENDHSFNTEHYRLGYQECMSETMRFLVEVEGFFARESLCVKMISHLQKHCEAILSSERFSSNATAAPKDYTQHSVPNGSSTNNLARLRTPPHAMQDHYDNSHLRDMLTANMSKEEAGVHMVLNPVARPVSRESVASSVPIHSMTPDLDKPESVIYRPSEYDYLRVEDANRTQTATYQKTERIRKVSETEMYDKSRECSNGASLYKFKNNIKQRFSQDLNAECKEKRRKLSEPCRRSSLTNETYLSENHSSMADENHSSPPVSEICTRISSESENTSRISPAGSSVSDIRLTGRNSPKNLKIDSNVIKAVSAYGRCSPVSKMDIKAIAPKYNEKHNFGIPIFVLHTKGSFYIPLTIDYAALLPYLQNYNILDVLPNVHNIVLHPVTINVNFQSGYSAESAVKPEKSKPELHNGWHC